MSGLDDLLSRSRSPGTFVERREFTLSRDKAVEKLREFSLRHPAGYVLELVQAAVFAGATYIAIDISDEALLVAWVGGRSCQAHQLESIFDYLFLARTDPETRHLSQLAIGLNALLQRKPTLVRLESGDGTAEGTVRVDLDQRGIGALGRPDLAMAGTYLLVRFRTGWLDRFDGEDFHAEQALVESRCVYSPVPILLNGSAPFGYRASTQLRMFGTQEERSFEDGGRRGVVAIPGLEERSAKHRAPLGFRIVVGGVWITTIDLPVLGRAPGDVPLVGVLCDDSLRKTADQSDIVQDRAFVRLLHAVQPHSTALIRASAGPGWQPPELPPLPEEVMVRSGESAGPVAEALPAQVDQLGARAEVPLELFEALPEKARLFWVRPEDSELLELAADPSRFPYPVLLLTPGQARSLTALAPALNLAPLASAADVDFVNNTLERQREVHRLQGSLTHRGRKLELRLRFDHGGCPDPLHGGGIPVSMGSGARSTLAGTIQLDLPGVSVHLVAPGEQLDHELEEALAERVVSLAWRWVVPGRDQITGDGPPQRDLRCALLRESLRPLFVEGDDLALEVALLGLDAGQRAAVMEMPLADAADGPLTLARLVATLGTERVITLPDPAEATRLEALQELLGWGHLAHGDQDAFPLCAVGCHGGSWRAIGRRDLSGGGCEHLIFLPLCFRTPPVLTAWRRRPWALPLLGAASVRSATSEPDWEQGLRLFERELARMSNIDGWGEPIAQGVPEAWCGAMGGMGLAVLRAIPDGAHALWEAADAVPLGQREPLVEGPGVVPRGGAVPMGHDTTPMSFDELTAVNRVLATRKLRLHLDDAPSSYGLDEADEAWALRQEIRGAGLRGWLGLRIPFDPTAAVLIHSSRSLYALHGGEQHLPVHGNVRLPRGATVPSEDQEELLQLERLLLYQRLPATLDAGDLPGETMLALRHYAAAFAVDAWRRGRLNRGVARELAARVPCPPHGSLLDWLNHDDPGTAPSSLHPCLARFYEAGPLHDRQFGGGARELGERLQRALGHGYDFDIASDLQYLEDAHERMRLVDRGHHAGPLFVLNLRHGMVTTVVDAGRSRGSTTGGSSPDPRVRRARDLLLLDMAWRFARWARGRSLPVDLPAIHRALLAASLDS